MTLAQTLTQPESPFGSPNPRKARLVNSAVVTFFHDGGFFLVSRKGNEAKRNGSFVIETVAAGGYLRNCYRWGCIVCLDMIPGSAFLEFRDDQHAW